MSRNYDNWERLVAATLRREHLWQLFHSHSRSPSISSRASEISSASPLSNVPLDFSSSSSWYRQNSDLGCSANGLETKHIVKVEKLHEVNPLAPAEIYVNGKLVYPEQLAILLSCQHPPKKLKPGYYWYDKISGFWGKQGQKPSQIISPHLLVGGSLDSKASNGNTLVYINNREITKVELTILKLAGVQCSRHTWFWMSEEGFLELEGMNYIVARLWDKAITKLLCSVFSLPFPPKSSTAIEGQYVPDHLTPSSIQKLLLIGHNGSGTSAIFKQAMFLYKDVPLSENELNHIAESIQGSTYVYICLLLNGRERFEEEHLKELPLPGTSKSSKLFAGYDDDSDYDSDYDNDEHIGSLELRLKYISKWLLRVKATVDVDNNLPPEVNREYAAIFEELWSNVTLQEILKPRRESKTLPSVADYFLERAIDIFKPDYKPSHMDIIRAKAFPLPLSCMDFSFPPSHWDLQNFTPRYQLIYLPTKGFGDSFGWLEMHEGASIVIIAISLNDYDQHIIDDDGAPVNKMMCCRNFFGNIAIHPIFDRTKFLLLLTKYDLFEEKVMHIPLNQCDWFNDFHPVRGSNNEKAVFELAQMSFHYIAVKFKRIYTSLTGKKLYVIPVNCLELDDVESALEYAKEILKWDAEQSSYLVYSSDSFSSEEDF